MKESVQNRLRRYNIKPSVERMAVLAYLMTDQTPPPADQSRYDIQCFISIYSDVVQSYCL